MNLPTPPAPNPEEPPRTECRPENAVINEAIDAAGWGKYQKLFATLRKEWKGLQDGKILFGGISVVVLLLLYLYLYNPLKAENKSLHLELAPYRAADGVVKALYPSTPKDERPDKIIEIVSQQADAINGLKGLVSEDVAGKLGALPQKEWMEIAFSNLNARLPQVKETVFSVSLNNYNTSLKTNTTFALPESRVLDFKFFNVGPAEIDSFVLLIHIPTDSCDIEDMGKWRREPGTIHAKLKTDLTNITALSYQFTRKLQTNTYANIDPIRLSPIKKASYIWTKCFFLGMRQTL